ncbi:MAG TPA: LPXTG cell wall anchor domain-containing protein, partial [Saprospiraceae bacterium]|nr:LPXTG cell wall anchor domain-containing protein [Saprospiraceae bacterium]
EAKKMFLAGASPSQRHPYFWAGFVLSGSIEAETNSYLNWFILAGVLAMALLTVILVKKNKKNKNLSQRDVTQ